MAASGRTVPSLIEVANSEAFLDPDARPANSRVFLDTIPYIRRVPNISTWPEVEDAAELMLEQALLRRHIRRAGGPADHGRHGRTLFARAER